MRQNSKFVENANLIEPQPEVAKESSKVLIVGDLPIDVIDMKASAEMFAENALRRRNSEQRPFYSTSANGQVLVQVRQDKELRDLFLKADQIHADGMPLVFASRIRHPVCLPERVATTDLVHEVARVAVAKGLSFYVLGANETSNANSVANLKALYPGLKIAGRRNGYIGVDEEANVIDEINAAAPDILWIGMGAPKEQQFVDRNIDKLTGVGVIKTCGGLLDFLSGKSPRAPQWMQDVGLEWLYRAIQEPRRLGPRYFTTNPMALYLLFVRK